MSSELLVHALVVGGGLLALWIYVRLGERRPRSLALVCVHVVVAGVALGFVPSAFAWVTGEREAAPILAVGLFGVFLPAMTYTFVAALLLIEQLQRALYRR